MISPVKNPNHNQNFGVWLRLVACKKCGQPNVAQFFFIFLEVWEQTEMFQALCVPPKQRLPSLNAFFFLLLP